MDLPCSALGAIQLRPVLPLCPSLHVLPSFMDVLRHRNCLSVCVCAALTPPVLLVFTAQAYLIPVDAVFVFCPCCSV